MPFVETLTVHILHHLRRLARFGICSSLVHSPWEKLGAVGLGRCLFRWRLRVFTVVRQWFPAPFSILDTPKYSESLNRHRCIGGLVPAIVEPMVSEPQNLSRLTLTSVGAGQTARLLFGITGAASVLLSVDYGQPHYHIRAMRLALGTTSASQRLALCASLILSAITSSHAGYSVQTQVESEAGRTRYTWTVHNPDQSWGLDIFVLEVPLETRVLAKTVPPPYSSADGTGYWIMEERYKESLDPHDGRVIYPAPKPGMKWLVWWGMESPSVYPPGTSAIFSLTTDSSVAPGRVNALAVTYTPQFNPHYYQPWQGAATGPSTVTTKTSASAQKITNLQAYAVFATNTSAATSGTQASTALPEPALAINLHAGLTLQGVVGRTYRIECTDDLGTAGAWRQLATVTLSAPKETWYDPAPASQQQRFYRIVPEASP